MIWIDFLDPPAPDSFSPGSFTRIYFILLMNGCVLFSGSWGRFVSFVLWRVSS